MTISSSHSAASLAPRPAKQVVQSLLRDLWRYKLVIPAVAAIVAGGITIYTARQTPVYEANTTLEHDPNPSRPLGRAIEDESPGSAFWSTQEFYETQNFILKSRGLAERVVRKLGLNTDASFILHTDAKPGSDFTPVPVDRAAQALLSRIKITQIQDTRVVRITVEDISPDRAQLIANALVDEYIEKSLEDRIGSGARSLQWLGGQLENLKRELEGSELTLYKFREENQTLSASLEERQRLIARQLQTYNDALTDLQTRQIEKQSLLTVLRENVANAPDLTSLETGPMGADGSLYELRKSHRHVVDQIEKLSLTYGRQHPDMVAARNEQMRLEAQIRAQVGALVASAEAELRQLNLAQQGLQKALKYVNQQGLELSVQETTYKRLDRDRESKTALYNLVMERAAQTDLTRALRVAPARVVDRALKPTRAVRPRVQLAATFGTILGLMAGVAVALAVAQLDNKVRSLIDLESRGLTVLGVIPSVGSALSGAYGGRRSRRRSRVDDDQRDLIVYREPRSVVAECCRTIRTNLTFQSADKPLRTIAITSAMPRDGKTTVAVSLGITIAQSGRRVLLVDTDLRKPRLHKALNLPVGNGVTSIVAGDATLESATQSTDVPGLTALQCGPIPPNPSELLHTRRFSELVEAARNAYDVVIFDSPPLGAVTDAAIISTTVDGIILVVRARSTARASVTAAMRNLRDVSARVIGAILNDVNLNDSSYGSYYAYYRGYYAEDDKGPPSTPGSTAKTAT